MALTENTQIDRIEVVDMGIVQVRQATTIERDGEPVTKTFHRWVLTPGSDISDQPDNVKAIAKAAWTPEVIAAFKAQQEANKL